MTPKNPHELADDSFACRRCGALVLDVNSECSVLPVAAPPPTPAMAALEDIADQLVAQAKTLCEGRAQCIVIVAGNPLERGGPISVRGFGDGDALRSMAIAVGGHAIFDQARGKVN